MRTDVDGVFLPRATQLSAAATSNASSHRSWIQIARTGSFVSGRYGEFSITPEDMAQMVRNFREITPQPPTQLPIDFDRLSIEPKKPGDGKAAGWLQALDLRAAGHELWGEVEWTLEAASLIREGSYRFVSASFVKNYTHKDGSEIGTTLLAAAITNHPYIEGMQPMTLDDFQNSSPSNRQTNEMEERVHTLTAIEARAAGFAQRVAAKMKGRTTSEAISLAASQDPEGAEAYRLAGVGASVDAAASRPSITLSLSVRTGESFDNFVRRYAPEKNVGLREAIHEVCLARPDLAATR